MGWRTIVLTDEQCRLREDHQLQSLFDGVFVESGRPADAALFGEASSKDGAWRFYLSPRGVEIFDFHIRQYSARRCEAPDQTLVSLLVGLPAAWLMLLRSVSSRTA